jgi:predicted nucleic acid-binding protein
MTAREIMKVEGFQISFDENDNHLLSLSKFQEIKILKVREFLQKITEDAPVTR